MSEATGEEAERSNVWLVQYLYPSMWPQKTKIPYVIANAELDRPENGSEDKSLSASVRETLDGINWDEKMLEHPP